MGDFWIIVNKVAKDPTAFVLRPDEVKRLAVRQEKDGRVSFWLSASAYDTDEFREAWSRLGRGDGAA